MEVWKDDSVMLDERIDLLARNGIMGLVLVVLVLALFLDLRLAFWVALGIPLSFAGAFILAPVSGVSINMVSLFALIVVLGLVVDDAIVVGENIYELEQKGRSRLEASIEGAQQMAVPVTFAVFTSVAAFAPLLFVPGFMGKIFGIIPVIVISVLLFSLLEGFFVLPSHLAHQPSAEPNPLVRGVQWVVARTHTPVQAWFSSRLERFTEGPYHRFVRMLIAGRYTTLAVAVSSFILTIGLLKAQIVPFSFFPKLEANNVNVNVRLPYGAPEVAAMRVRGVLE
jgi:multidrug efflux pump subunit AcrB